MKSKIIENGANTTKETNINLHPFLFFFLLLNQEKNKPEYDKKHYNDIIQNTKQAKWSHKGTLFSLPSPGNSKNSSENEKSVCSFSCPYLVVPIKLIMCERIFTDPFSRRCLLTIPKKIL